MRKPLFVALLAIAGLWPAAASAELRLNFVAPEHYWDASLHGGYGARRYERAVKELDKIFQALAARYLRPGDQLTLDVLDVDLAGEYEPSRYSYEVRLMTDTTWPRMKLRYVLTRPDTAPVSGDELVSDRNYLTFPNFRSGSETLSYERIMLERWFKARFAAPKPG